MDTIDVSDDFERFCQIAQRSPRDMLSPKHVNQSATGRMSMQADYLATPESEQLKRASSFREPRRRASFQPGSYSGDISASRSPVRLNHPPNYSNDGGSYLQSTNLSTSQNFSRQKPRFSEDVNMTMGRNVDFEQYPNDNIYEEDANYPNSLTVGRIGPLRKRPGSMKETGRNRHLVDRYGYRPSVPVVHPGNYAAASYSPNKFRSTPSEENMVRVRRFERNKHGQVISKGDKDVPQIEIFTSRSPSGGSRNSFTDKRPSDDVRLNAMHSSESSLSEADVIEIPAITTTLASPSRSPVTSSPRYLRKRASSPTRNLRPEARIRSKSLAMVWDRSSPQSCSPPSCENPIANHLLHVQVLGTSRVGKTSMCMQFHTSESIEDPGDTNFDDENDRPVTVEVNSVKASLVFIEADVNPDELQDDFTYPQIMDTADAFLVVYAIDDRASFYSARKIIGYLLSQCKRSSAIILAANKSDLVRTRVVSEDEGKSLAQVYSCSYFEVSTSLNHRVDDLLVGILVAIQSQQINAQKERSRLDRMASQRRGSHGSPKHKSSITALKSPANSVVKFFRKHFVSKKNQQGLL